MRAFVCLCVYVLGVSRIEEGMIHKARRVVLHARLARFLAMLATVA